MTATASRYVEAYPIDRLAPHPRNYRGHPDDQLEHIAASIRRHGVYRNVVAARDGTLLAGHGVVAALRRLGRDTTPVTILDVSPDDPGALALLAGDNEMANLAETDDRALTELLRELSGEDLDLLLGTGFDAEQLAALAIVTRPASELGDLDQAGEWLGLPGFEAAPVVPQITLKFLDVETRDRFLSEVLDPGHTIVKKVGDAWTAYWPDRPRNDLRSVRFEDRHADA